jgi:hypothetical protein
MVFLRFALKKLPKAVHYVKGFVIALFLIAIAGWLIEWLKRL